MFMIRIHNQDFTLRAQIDDTPIGRQVAAALPIRAHAQVWGEEIYFGIPVKLDNAPGAGTEVEIGDLAYWPPGSAFCIFFGRTPESRGDEPRAAGPVTVFGRLTEDPRPLHFVHHGDPLTIERDD